MNFEPMNFNMTNQTMGLKPLQNPNLYSAENVIWISPQQNATATANTSRNEYAHDLLIGAQKIAEAFGLTRRQVYNLKEGGEAPIRNIPKLGIAASKKELGEYLTHG
jgi:hypothetical protein